MTTKKEQCGEDGEKVVELCIDGHPVTLSFLAEPNPTAAQRVRNSLIDSYLCQSMAKRKAASSLKKEGQKRQKKGRVYSSR